MTDINIFEIASRRKFRFESVKGPLTVEQLWDLPLTSPLTASVTGAKADLDSIARGVNFDLKGVTEESFVNVRPDPRKPDLETKLELVKYIIAEKIKEAAEKTAKRRTLLDALAAREQAELTSASKEELLKQLEALDA